MWSLPHKRPDFAPRDRSLVTVSTRRDRPGRSNHLSPEPSDRQPVDAEKAGEVLRQTGSEPLQGTVPACMKNAHRCIKFAAFELSIDTGINTRTSSK
jgi:hypothetical protein